MKLDKVGYLFAASYRSRAYTQIMIANDLVPSYIFRLKSNEPKIKDQKKVKSNYSDFVFDPNISDLKSFRNLKHNVKLLQTDDINSDEVYNILESTDISVLVYCGLPGVIIKRKLIQLGIKILHVHGGKLPEYKGSTAFYFSLLERKKIGASALFINEKIDEGPVIIAEEFLAYKGQDIDYILDPLARAEVLRKTLTNIKFKKNLNIIEQDTKGYTYNVIHPLLKHLALKNNNLI